MIWSHFPYCNDDTPWEHEKLKMAWDMATGRVRLNHGCLISSGWGKFAQGSSRPDPIYDGF